MSTRQKPPIRQLSLQSNVRIRPILKKQYSVDERNDIPKPVRIAWSENETKKDTFPVEVTKCKEHKRPATAKIRQQSIENKEQSILFTRQELAERIRQAWKQREESKQNLDIFLTHNIPIRDNEPDEHEYEVSKAKPKQEDVKTSISVTIPNVAAENGKEFESIPVRSLTAAAKRESFQKRSNSAFNHTFSSPSSTPLPNPARLIRALSIPTKQENNKLKLLTSKRRIKSSRKKDEVNGGQDESKKGSRCKSAPSGELITMVSLVSPAGSDTEECSNNKKTDNVSIIKFVSNVTSNVIEKKNATTLRKIVKSVSFQQSSIHSVRSFSASFPSSRKSVQIMSSGAAAAAANQLLFEREKRAPLEETSPRESRGPKRRLVRVNNTSSDRCENTTTTTVTDSFDPTQTNSLDDIESKSNEAEPNQLEKTSEDKQNEENKNDEDEDEKKIIDPTPEPDTPKFNTRKEKECWIMYKKMCEKGLPVSFDTILRGMLTPTEYRTARKEIVTA